MILRPGKTASGVEVRAHLRRLVRQIREQWPATRILFRGDGHYARPEAMAWSQDHGVHYIFGLPGTKPLSRKVDEAADAVHVERALDDQDAASATPRRATAPNPGIGNAAPLRASRRRGSASTSVSPSPIFRMARRNGSTTASIARGQAENLIKLHKAQLCSDRTSCRSALANQVRLVLHTAAYWLMLGVRDAIPKPRDLAKAEFSTLRLRLLKIAARVIETASRVRLAFSAAYPEADLFCSLPAALLMPCGP